MKIAFILYSFPVLSETFILQQIIGVMKQVYKIKVFSEVHPQEQKVHQDFLNYNLAQKTNYFTDLVPKNKMERIKNALIFIVRNFPRHGWKIIKALNFFKYKSKAINLEYLYYTMHFMGMDVIHCHFGPVGKNWIFLKEIFPKTKFIVSFHGFDVNSYPKIMPKGVYLDLFKKADLFTVNSNFTKQQLIKLGCAATKIVKLAVGVKIDSFTFSERTINPAQPVKILSLGRLVEKKGHEYAIRSMAKVVNRHKHISYTIAGNGPLRKKLETLATELGIKNYIKFLGGVNQEQALRLYQDAHIFVLPSVTANNGDREGQALVLQEAQATGLPVVSTWHNGIPEGVLDGQSGFLVPEKDADALAERIEYLINHPQEWPQMGKTGRSFVKEKFDINKLNRRLIDIYQGKN